jgi:ATP-dependent Clp protease protease subunit
MKKAVIVGGIVVVAGLVAGFTSFRNSEKVTTSTTEVATPKVTNNDPGLNVSKLAVTKITPGAGQVILLNTEVSDESMDAVLNQLYALEGQKERVYLVITSPGGSVFAGNRLVSYLESTNLDVVTVCSQVCASMAFHIFEAGRTRLMEAHSLLMGHPASGGARGTIPEMLSMLNAIKTMTDRMDAAIAKRAKIKYHDFEVSVLRNLWVETPDAIRMGLADGAVHLSFANTIGLTFDTAAVLKSKKIKAKTVKDLLPTLYEIN